MQVILPERAIKCLFYGFMTYAERIFAKMLYPDPDNPQIKNYKHQISNKSQISNKINCQLFEILSFGHCNLFGICFFVV